MRQFWHGVGSDERYKPRWWERRAYARALEDANRIIEVKAWEAYHDGDRDARPDGTHKLFQRALFSRSVEVAPCET